MVLFFILNNCVRVVIKTVMKVERSDIQQVMQQMRSLREQAQPPEVRGLGSMDGIKGVSSTEGSFSNVLEGALESVNKVQQESSRLAKAYELGDPGVDLTRVMVASQKASISFQAAMQVRNKLVNAYQEIMNMPI